jgi:hypothetical protein
LLMPLAAWGQKWIEPQTDSEGNFVEGHWQTPDDLRKDNYSTPGKVNPYTGQFTPYTDSLKVPQSQPPLPANPNPYYPPQDYRYQGR